MQPPGNSEIAGPAHPAVEERIESWEPAPLPEGGDHHGLDEPVGGDLQHLQLQVFLGAEVGEQAALGETELPGQRGEAEAFEAVARRETEGRVEDAVARFRALGHRPS